MKNFTPRATRLAFVLAAGALVVSPSWPLTVDAQTKTSAPATRQDAGQSTAGDRDLAAQLHELKTKAAVLEAALERQNPATTGKDAAAGKGMSKMRGGLGMMGSRGKGLSSGGMGGDDDEMAEMMKMMRTMMEMKMMQMKNKGMGMMDDEMMGGMGGKKKGMSGMSGTEGMKKGMDGMMDMDMDMDMMMGSGMGMMEDGMDMMGMMGKGSMGRKGMKMKMTAALPGFSGASHIYHIGATGFFLDHPEHVDLTDEQQTSLNGIKEKAMLEQATMQRQIDEAEQELWTLTASDQPDAEQIVAKVREIEKLRGDQRLSFIRSVGEAANVLTDEQRKLLLGQAKSDAHKAHPAATK